MTDITDIIDAQVKAQRAETFAQSDQLSLGEIITKCEAIVVRDASDPPRVVFDFEYAHPVSIGSWRGIYSELALGFDLGGEEMTLPAFTELLRSAVGKEFCGYKGGDYTMSRHTPVWVANHGHTGNTAVVGVLDGGWQVVILTTYRES